MNLRHISMVALLGCSLALPVHADMEGAIGAVTGGLFGSMFGEGNGRLAATAAGVCSATRRGSRWRVAMATARPTVLSPSIRKLTRRRLTRRRSIRNSRSMSSSSPFIRRRWWWCSQAMVVVIMVAARMVTAGVVVGAAAGVVVGDAGITMMTERGLDARAS